MGSCCAVTGDTDPKFAVLEGEVAGYDGGSGASRARERSYLPPFAVVGDVASPDALTVLRCFPYESDIEP
jgi:hypothetical protein